MLGSIAGDMIGSPYEAKPIKDKHFPLFGPNSRATDDSVQTCAVATSILNKTNLAKQLKGWFFALPYIGYGPMFAAWAKSDSLEPYGSYGNGSAMRVSPIGWAYDDARDLLHAADASARVTHNSVEGIRGSIAVADCIREFRCQLPRSFVRKHIEAAYGYDLSKSVDEIRPDYKFDPTCRGSVPQAITCALESTDWEDAVRLAVSLGGDSDTLACIAGSIAEAIYGEVPAHIAKEVEARCEPLIWFTWRQFAERFRGHHGGVA